MPVISIQYTANVGAVDEAALLREVCAVVSTHPAFPDETDVKAHIQRLERWHVGLEADSAKRGFVHASMALVSGRSVEVRRALADAMAGVLHERLPASEGVMVQVTVDIVEMQRETFYKARL